MCKFQVTFYPGIEKKDLESGVVSNVSWQRMSNHLNQIFQIQPSEKIVGITVSEDGIKASIQRTI